MSDDELSATARKAFGVVVSGLLSVPEPSALKTAHTTATTLLSRAPADCGPWPAVAIMRRRRREDGFTLAELLVTMGVLVLLVFLFTQLLNSAATVTTLGHKQMDLDSQAREVLDRMRVDFAKMVKRPEVDYYLKSSGVATDCAACGTQTGNDQAAFYSTVTGYFPTVPTPAPSYTQKSPVSLLSYRVNSDSTSSSYNKMERMGKGLAWNGFSPSWTPVVFLPRTISGNWPAACYPRCTSDPNSSTDPAYEIMGPQVFRFEYYYMLKTNGSFRDTPWDPAHSTVNGMRDVAAIIIDIAAIDSKSKVLLTDPQIASLAGQLGDYSSGMVPGQLLANWRTTIDTSGLPPTAISGIRVYERFFYLNQ
jgi:hypothetical protein